RLAAVLREQFFRLFARLRRISFVVIEVVPEIIEILPLRFGKVQGRGHVGRSRAEIERGEERINNRAACQQHQNHDTRHPQSNSGAPAHILPFVPLSRAGLTPIWASATSISSVRMLTEFP